MVNLPISGLSGPAPGFIPFYGIANSNGSLTLEFFFLLYILCFFYLGMIMPCHAKVIHIVSVVTKLKVEYTKTLSSM